MGFILQDVCLKCLPAIYSIKNSEKILDKIIYGISEETRLTYCQNDSVASLVKELEKAGYVVSTEIDKKRVAVSLNLRRVKVKNGKWICFRRHKKAPHC